MRKAAPAVLIAALLFGAAALSRAETSVGLDASGIDPSWALNNAQGLDVRDAMGRPVSAALIESQMRAAQAEAVSRSAWSSRLPQARAIFKALDLLTAFAAAWRALRRPERPAVSPEGLPAPERKFPAYFAVLTGCVLSFCLSLFEAPGISRSGFKPLKVALRC